MKKKILFLGCGKMGSIIANNIVQNIDFAEVVAVDPFAKKEISAVKYFEKINEVLSGFKADVVFFAIKPQGSKASILEFVSQNIFHKKTIFISILAGKKIEFFENILGKNKKIIRSMPNLPIEVNQGILPYFCNENIDIEDRKFLQKLFAAFGFSFEIKDEKLFDVLTALCGSGPAYVFLLQEIFSKIAVDFGIDEKDAQKLVKKLFLGSALMAEKSSLNFKELKDSVTSKGGTTEAALNILQDSTKLENLLKEAILRAKEKSEELSKN